MSCLTSTWCFLPSPSWTTLHNTGGRRQPGADEDERAGDEVRGILERRREARFRAGAAGLHLVRAFFPDGGRCCGWPRVKGWFDDVTGDEWGMHSPYAGELAAIEEYNAGHEAGKIAPINGLAQKRRIPAAWNDQIFVSSRLCAPALRQAHPPVDSGTLQLSQRELGSG